MPARSTRSLLTAAASLAVVALALAPAWSPTRPGGPVAASATTAVGAPTGAVTVGIGEAPGATVVHWDPGADTGPGAVDLYDAGALDPLGAAPLIAVPTGPGSTGVLLPPLDPAKTYLAVVTVTGASESRRLGPSAPFTAGDVGPVGSASLHAAAGPPTPCLGAGYGLGAVSVDGWAGVQGSYCLPPGFASGTGAFCVDHGLDYPAGAYTWAASSVGEGVALVDQHAVAANPDDVARLAYVVASWGSTTDPARAVAVGLVAHAVMGDYPGLHVADLTTGNIAVHGGDPAAVVADAVSMWSTSGSAGGPYDVTVAAAPGPLVVGAPSSATVTVTGRGGAPEAAVAVDLSASTGATVTPTTAVTGADGRLGFTFTPTSQTVDLVAHATSDLPGDALVLWTPQHPPVAVQRVVTAGPPLHPAGAVALSATAPATATLEKLSSDPAVAVGAGFGFSVDVEGPGGWTPVATRSTGADGSIAPVTGLSPGTYRVTEIAAPVAFATAGPWQFDLTAGQQATWALVDQPVPQPLTVHKTGDDTAVLPVAGAAFDVDSLAPDGTATPVGQVSTGRDGTTPAIQVAPGRYRVTETTPPAGYAPAAAITIDVAPVGPNGPQPQVASVTDAALPGTIEVVKTDAATGDDVAGASVAVGRVAADGTTTPAGTLTTGAGPTDLAVAPGRYRVVESSPPPGYLDDAAPSLVDVGPGQVLQVVLADHAVPTTTAPAPTTAVPTSAAPTTAAPTTAAPTTVATTTTTVAAAASGAGPGPPGLAFTGIAVWRWLLASAALVGLGTSIVGLGRRPGTARG